MIFWEMRDATDPHSLEREGPLAKEGAGRGILEEEGVRDTPRKFPPRQEGVVLRNVEDDHRDLHPRQSAIRKATSARITFINVSLRC